MTRLAPALTICLALLAAACGTTREGLDPERMPAEELIRRVRAESEKVRTIAATGTLVFDSPRISGAAEFTLALDRPDSLLMKLEGPFGVDVGLLFMDARRYVAYSSMDNEVMEGPADSAALRAFIPIPLAPRQIMDAFSGRYPVDADARILGYVVDDDRFLLTTMCGHDTCRYWIDPGALAVTSYRRTGPDSRVLIEAELTMMTEVDGIELPRTIVVKSPSRRSMLRIQYADLEVNGDPPEFLYTIPSSARRRGRPLP
jgi:Domain of unknown function (DUF4292)